MTRLPALGSLVRADVRSRWRSLAVLALLVAIIVGGVLTTTAGARRTRTAFDRYLAQVNPADLIVLLEGEPIGSDDAAAVDGVDAAVGVTMYLIVPQSDPNGFYPMFTPEDTRRAGAVLPVADRRRPGGQPERAPRGRARRTDRAPAERHRGRQLADGRVHARAAGGSGRLRQPARSAAHARCRGHLTQPRRRRQTGGRPRPHPSHARLRPGVRRRDRRVRIGSPPRHRSGRNPQRRWARGCRRWAASSSTR